MEKSTLETSDSFQFKILTRRASEDMNNIKKINAPVLDAFAPARRVFKITISVRSEVATVRTSRFVSIPDDRSREQQLPSDPWPSWKRTFAASLSRQDPIDVTYLSARISRGGFLICSCANKVLKTRASSNRGFLRFVLRLGGKILLTTLRNR